MSRRAGFPSAVALLLVAGCSLVDPNVGPNLAACGAQAGPATAYGPAHTDAGGACAADAGSACDDCESRWCCQTRLACYADPVCDCADQAMDTCTEMAAADSGSGDAGVGRCWNAFSASGDVAKSRFACLRAWCQGVCGVP
jgi:hypothetical protein